MDEPQYTAIIAEDEIGDLQLLEKLLARHPEIKIVARATKVSETRNAILNYKPDMAFLDIELHGEYVFEALDKIKEYQLDPYLVFITAFSHFDRKVIDYKAVKYLEKPISFEDLEECIRAIKADIDRKRDLQAKLLLVNQSYKKIILSDQKQYLFLSPDEILFVEAEKGQSYTNIFLTKKRHEVITKGIGELEKELLPLGFLKIHRSITLNPKHLFKVDKKSGECFIGDKIIVLSTDKIREIKDRMAGLGI